MDDPQLSLATSIFAPGKMIIKRASFPGGETPEHLKDYLIKKGEFAGYKGKTIYHGKTVPKVAAEVGKRKKKGI